MKQDCLLCTVCSSLSFTTLTAFHVLVQSDHDSLMQHEIRVTSPVFKHGTFSELSEGYIVLYIM